MKQRYFEDLSRCLKKRGVAPGLVKRLVTELGDHADDAAGELREQGVPEDDACRRVLDGFGPPEQFACALADDYRRRSFSGRHPLLSFGLGPLAVMTVLLIAPVVLGSQFAPDIREALLPRLAVPLQRVYAFSEVFLNAAAPFIASVIFACVGIKGRHRIAWAGLSCGLLSLAGLLLSVRLLYDPSPDCLHSSTYTLGLGLSSRIPPVNLVAALLPVLVFCLYALHKKFVEK